jgi:ABC-2 type transport system permease protein
MNSLKKLTWVEMKLFIREPITVVFTLALPLIVLFVLGQAFGNTRDPEVDIFRGLGPMDFYTPAYIGLVISSIGLIALPVHLAGFREKGVLRRMRASSVSIWSMFGSQLIVTFVIAAISGALLTIASMLTYDVYFAKSVGLMIAGFIIGTLCFAAIGIFLGAVLPTARSAQGVGLVLFFVMLFICGGGPPPEVIGSGLRGVAQAMPLTHLIVLLQDAWNGFGWNYYKFLIVIAFMIAAALLSLRFFRWE